jgi:acetyltransferase-like isoleucine patch superfamily enzyme
MAAFLASSLSPPYKGCLYLSGLNPKGYISHSARIHHNCLVLGSNIFIADNVVIYQAKEGGKVEIGNRSQINQGVIIETGSGGSLSIGSGTSIQPRCQFSAYAGSIRIGNDVQIAPNCGFYPYNHGCQPDKPIKLQPLKTMGGIVIEDDAWIGFGAVILDGVCVGEGAIVGAGAVVTRSIPPRAIAAGNPAKIIKMREELSID